MQAYRMEKLEKIATAALALVETDYPDLLANYDTHIGNPEGDFERECPEEFKRWKALKDALAELQEFNEDGKKV